MRSLKQVLAVFLLAVLLAGMTPAAVFGADSIKLSGPNVLFVMQGASTYIDVEAQAPADTEYKLVLECADHNITMTNGKSGTMAGDGKYTMSLSVARQAEVGNYNLVLKAVDPKDSNKVLAAKNLFVSVTENKNSYSSLNGPAMEVTYALQENDHLVAGQVNYVTFTLYNRGNKNYSNGKVTISMEKGMTIQSGALSRNVGRFNIGDTVSVQYPILIDSSVENGSYPFVISFGALTTQKSEEGETQAVNADMTETVYIPLVGKEKSEEDTSIPVIALIGNKIGGGTGSIKKGSDFNLDLTFKNTGKSKTAKDITITVSDASGAVAPASSELIYLESMKAGETVTQTIPMKAIENSDENIANVNVTLGYYDEDGKNYNNTAQFSINLEDATTTSGKGVANPILMVTNYSFGSDKAVMANSQFPLSLTITNTSAKTLRNIKVTVQDSTGSILPAEGSNSFFINSIGAGSSYGKLMPMAVSNDIKAGVSTIAVNMSYEDMDAHTFTSSDTITVPVTLQDRLVIDDILDPGNLMAGEMGYAQIKYYNMGQTTLNNLRIAVSGDFTIDGDSSQYVGNMANGRSDYFSFNFMPNSEGTMNGKAVFTYENAQGEEQVIEKEFTFNIQPAPEFNPEDMDFPVEEEKHGFAALPIWGKGLVALGALLAVILVIKGIKKHKKAKAEALTLDE